MRSLVCSRTGHSLQNKNLRTFSLPSVSKPRLTANSGSYYPRRSPLIYVFVSHWLYLLLARFQMKRRGVPGRHAKYSRRTGIIWWIAFITIMATLAPSGCISSGPEVSSVAVSVITGTSARITWLTQRPCTSQVEYGSTPDCGSASSLDETDVSHHSVTLSRLVPGSRYFFRVKSSDRWGNSVTSQPLTFVTEAEQSLQR